MPDAPRPAGTPWIRLDRIAGWGLSDVSSGYVAGDEIALGRPGQRPIADTEPFGSFGGRRLPRNVAISADGRIFVADPENRVILTAVNAPEPRTSREGPGQIADAPAEDTVPSWRFEPLWPARPLPPPADPHEVARPPQRPADPYTLVAPVAIALAPNGDLVVVDRGGPEEDAAAARLRGRVVVFALPSGAVRRVIDLVRPVAVSVDRRGRACIADSGTGRILRFDASWRREPGYPDPALPPIEDLRDIAHVACEPSDERASGPEPDLFVLAGRRILALTEGGRLWSGGRIATVQGGVLPTAEIGERRLMPPALRLEPDGALLWPDPAYPLRDALRLRGVPVDGSGRIAGTDLPLLARPRRLLLPRTGVLRFAPLDGGREGFAWDRVGLAADIPERTRVLLSSFTSDAPLEEGQVTEMPAERWSAPLEIGPGDLPESLVQSPPGRYLWLRLELFGDGTRTPRIGRVDIHAPRASSLADLPAPFHEDPESARFLDRFLSYFDVVFAEVSAQAAQTTALVRPRAVPAGPFLDWLASWFDITFLPTWPERVRRVMIENAVAHYRRRGTVPGLRQMLQWHTGLGEPYPAVIEHFRLPGTGAWIGGAPLSGQPAAHAFTIVLPASVAPDEPALRQLERVIEAATPAHCRYDLRLVEPGLVLARQSTLGVDALLGPDGPAPLGAGLLGEDLVFPDTGSPPRPIAPGGHPRC